MIEQALKAFLDLLLSWDTLLILGGYLLLCHWLVSRLNELMFALVLEFYWALTFTYLICRVFYADSANFGAVESSWYWIGGTLLALAILPAFAIRRISSMRTFPPLTGILHTTWLATIASAVLWGRGALLSPSHEILIVMGVVALVLTTAAGFALVGVANAAANAGNEAARNTATRTAGAVTVLVPILLYGATLRGL